MTVTVTDGLPRNGSRGDVVQFTLDEPALDPRFHGDQRCNNDSKRLIHSDRLHRSLIHGIGGSKTCHKP